MKKVLGLEDKASAELLKRGQLLSVDGKTALDVDDGLTAANILDLSIASLPRQSGLGTRIKNAVFSLRLQYYLPFMLASALVALDIAPKTVQADQGSDTLPVLESSNPSSWIPSPSAPTTWPDKSGSAIEIPVVGLPATIGPSEQPEPIFSSIPALPADLHRDLPPLSPAEPVINQNAAPPAIAPAVPDSSIGPAPDTPDAERSEEDNNLPKIPDIISPYRPDEYRLTIGDTISVFTANIPEFTTENIIRSDGSINLPVAGEIDVWGMTLPEAEAAITAHYVDADVLKNPDISVKLLASSPLKFAIAGEINRPGAYDVPVLDKRLPTITDAITLAGGIAGEADLRNVEVYRHNRQGGQDLIKLNLLALYKEADLSQNITLRSGDRVIIPNAPVFSDEAQLIASANISPNSMQIGVLGEVLSPGLIQAPTNTALNQALILVGGFNNRAKKTVQLIRTMEDGTVSREKIKIDWTANVGDESNPILKHRDVVLVGPSTIAKYSDFLDRALGPINRTIPFIGILDLLFPNNNNR